MKIPAERDVALPPRAWSRISSAESGDGAAVWALVMVVNPVGLAERAAAEAETGAMSSPWRARECDGAAGEERAEIVASTAEAAAELIFMAEDSGGSSGDGNACKGMC